MLFFLCFGVVYLLSATLVPTEIAMAKWLASEVKNLEPSDMAWSRKDVEQRLLFFMYPSIKLEMTGQLQ